MKLDVHDLDDLAIGATLLGSGGGGDPSADLLLAKEMITSRGSLEYVSVDDIPDDANIITAGYIGAPLVSIEKLQSDGEWSRGAELLGKHFWGIASAEIGGSNAFAGIIASIECGAKLIDADTLGRAFPYVHISSCALAGVGPAPASIVGGKHDGVVIHCRSPQMLEAIARPIVTVFGSTAAGLLYPMNGAIAKRALVRGSLSQAIRLGKLLKRSKSVSDFLSKVSSKHLGRGVIVDIIQHVEEGFLRGEVVVECDSGRIRVDIQNEYLLVRDAQRVLGTTPDIIALLDSNTLKPISSDQVRFGLSVDVALISAPSIWKTAAGLALTAPKAFGYNTEAVLICTD